MRLRRRGLQLERMTEFGRRIRQIAFLHGGPGVSDVQRRILVAIVSRNELATLPEFCCRFFRASGASQRQAKLIMSLPARGLQSRCLLELCDCFSNLAVLEKCFTESEVGTGERRRQPDDLAQLLDLLC